MNTKNLEFNEDDLNWVLIAAEKYMLQNPNCIEEIIKAHKVLNNIWFKMKLDQEYIIIEKPF